MNHKKPIEPEPPPSAELLSLKQRWQAVAEMNSALIDENKRLRELVERLAEHVAKESAHKRTA